MVHGILSHQNRRKQQRYDKYPHPSPKMRLLDNAVTILAILGPLATLPQAYNVWANHNVAGLSLTTWALYFIVNIPFLLYGIVHKERPIIVSNTLWAMLNFSVAAGIIMFG